MIVVEHVKVEGNKNVRRRKQENAIENQTVFVI